MIIKQVDQSTLSNELFEGHLRKFIQANLSNDLLDDLFDDFCPIGFYWMFIGSEKFIYYKCILDIYDNAQTRMEL